MFIYLLRSILLTSMKYWNPVVPPTVKRQPASSKHIACPYKARGSPKKSKNNHNQKCYALKNKIQAYMLNCFAGFTSFLKRNRGIRGCIRVITKTGNMELCRAPQGIAQMSKTSQKQVKIIPCKMNHQDDNTRYNSMGWWTMDVHNLHLFRVFKFQVIVPHSPGYFDYLVMVQCGVQQSFQR